MSSSHLSISFILFIHPHHEEKTARRSPNQQKQVPRQGLHSEANAVDRTIRPTGAHRGTAGKFAKNLEQKVAAWVEKYVSDDVDRLEKGLSDEQWQEVITEARFYCVQAPLEILRTLLPAPVYQQLPRLLAHAIINKRLWRIVEHPFYFLEPEHTPKSSIPIQQVPPERFSGYLRELLKNATQSE